MARSRNIKPGFFLNDKLGDLSPLTRLLFIGLWCIADREGRLEDRPKRIKAEVLPYDNCDIDELLHELDVSEFILRYEVEGAEYIQISNFSKHQNPHIKETLSTIPAPCDVGKSTIQELDNNGSFPADSLNPLTDSLNPLTDSDETNNDTPAVIPDSGGAQHKAGKGEFTTEFEQFWSLYPRQVEKTKAFSKWKVCLKEKACTDDLIKAASNYSKYCINKGTEEQFIKHPATFLGKDKPYEEYINWQPSKEQKPNTKKTEKKENHFSNYSNQREYDMEELRLQLLGRDTNNEQGDHDNE